MLKVLRVLALAIMASAVIAGCASPQPTDPVPPAATTEPAATTAPPATPTPTPTVNDEPSPAAVLPDGRSPVYLTSINVTKRTITFDLIIFLTGDAAKAEWVKEGKDKETGDAAPPNDYMIVNNNPKLRTLPVSTSASITYNNPDDSFAPTATTLAKLKGPFTYRPFWLTVKGGVITKIEEQFVP